MEDCLLYEVHPLENGGFLCEFNDEWVVLDDQFAEVFRGTTHSRFFCEDSFGNFYGSDRTGDLIGYRSYDFDRFAVLSLPNISFDSLKLCADKRIGAFFGVLDNDPLRSIAGFARLTQDGVEVISSWTTLGECVVFDYRPTSLGNKFLADSDPGDLSCTQLLNEEDGSVAWQSNRAMRLMGELDRLVHREVKDLRDQRIILYNYALQEIASYQHKSWVNIATSDSGEYFSIAAGADGSKVYTSANGEPVCELAGSWQVFFSPDSRFAIGLAEYGAEREIYLIEMNGTQRASYRRIGRTTRYCSDVAFSSSLDQVVLYESQGHYSNLRDLQVIRL